MTRVCHVFWIDLNPGARLLVQMLTTEVISCFKLHFPARLTSAWVTPALGICSDSVSVNPAQTVCVALVHGVVLYLCDVGTQSYQEVEV